MRAAVWDESWEDAMYAAWSVARYTAREGARNAARYAGLGTVDVINWDPARDGAWVAMTRKLTPTVRTLQASAVDLMERMAAVKSAAAPAEGAGAASKGNPSAISAAQAALNLARWIAVVTRPPRRAPVVEWPSRGRFGPP